MIKGKINILEIIKNLSAKEKEEIVKEFIEIILKEQNKIATFEVALKIN